MGMRMEIVPIIDVRSKDIADCTKSPALDMVAGNLSRLAHQQLISHRAPASQEVYRPGPGINRTGPDHIDINSIQQGPPGRLRLHLQNMKTIRIPEPGRVVKTPSRNPNALLRRHEAWIRQHPAEFSLNIQCIEERL